MSAVERFFRLASVNRATLSAANRISKNPALNRVVDRFGMYMKEKIMPSYMLGGLRRMAGYEFSPSQAREVMGMNIDAFDALISRRSLATRTMKTSEFNDKFGERAFLLDFRYSNFDGVDMSGLKLNLANFAGASFRNSSFLRADLGGAILAGANLTGTELAHVKFANADMTGANFSRSIIRNTDFTNAKLNGSNFSGAEFIDAQKEMFQGASLFGAEGLESAGLWPKAFGPYNYLLRPA